MHRHDAKKQLKGYLRDYVESITQKSKGTNLYVCPLCGSGKGKNGTGAHLVFITIQAGSALAVIEAEIFLILSEK